MKRFEFKKTKNSFSWDADKGCAIVFLIIAIFAAYGWFANIAKIFIDGSSGAEILARVVFAIAWPIGCIAGYF